MTAKSIRTCIAALVLALLAACGPDAAGPAQLLPVGAGPTPHPTAARVTILTEGRSLPGRLLFVAGGDLWRWETTVVQQLTTGGGLAQPAWSPDGTVIVCVRRGESASDLELLGPDGATLQRLTDNLSRQPSHSYERVAESIWALYPTFTPGGDEITFVSQYGPPFGEPAAEYHLGLYRLPRAGGVRTGLYASDEGQIGRGVYSPDGESLVFAFTPVGADAPRLLRYRSSDGAVAPIPGIPDQSYDPALSADGRWLAFAARDNGRTDIFAAPTAGGTPVRLTSLGSARAPAFAPDGSMMAFLAVAPGGQHFDLWVLDLTAQAGGLRAGTPQRLTQDVAIDTDSGLAWTR